MGTFGGHPYGSKPNQLFRNVQGKFQLDEQPQLRVLGRANGYTAPGPSADFDRDGRLDLFLANWWVKQDSLLLRNETPSGNWLQVAVQGNAMPGANGVNRLGVGARVRIYPVGKLGDMTSLLGDREIAVGYGYASGQEALAHWGLDKLDRCDVEIILPHGRGRLEKKDVAANQRITIAM